MTEENTYTSYLDLLSDKRFIAWKLTPTKESDDYWHAFSGKNPALQQEMHRAEEYLKENILNRTVWSENEYAELWQKIYFKTNHINKKRHLRRILYAAMAACITIALSVGGFHLWFKNNNAKQLQTERIEGYQLNEENIRLVTSTETIAFEKNMEVRINKEGTAKIVQEGNKEKVLAIEKKQPNKLFVPYGKRTQLTLSDGSRVWLNSGSVLEFPAQFADNQREIRLTSGEMYIEVAPDKKKSFFVHTSNFSVKVYGTKFNISAYTDSSPSVVLVEGSVSLKANNQKEQILEPDEQAIYSGNGMFQILKVDINQFTSWKDGYLTLNNTSISEILEQIGRYYNINFNLDNNIKLYQRKCKGKIFLSDNIDDTMLAISLLSHTKYKRENNNIYIQKKQ